MVSERVDIGLRLTPSEWKELWMLLYNVTGNNLVSPHVGPIEDNVRGPLQLSRSDNETVLDPLSLEELLTLVDVKAKLEGILFPGGGEYHEPTSCLHHTDPDGPADYWVSPFDPCPAIACQCPGGCRGTLRLTGIFRSGDGQLDCDTCGCGYVAQGPGAKENA